MFDRNLRHPMTHQEKQLYEFGPFHIDNVERLLFRGGKLIPLPPKAIDTLLALLSNAGRVLEKDELMKMVWRDSFVEEGGLARNISSLRKVFDDGSSEFQFIETIPKRGYRFVAPLKAHPGAHPPVVVVAPLPAPLPAPAPPTQKRRMGRWMPSAFFALLLFTAAAAFYFFFLRVPSSVLPRVRSLAVLPLSNLSNDPAQEFFADGMTEELINSLAKIEALRVISRTSAMTYKRSNKALPQIARELDVDAVVEGSVMQSAGRVRIIIQLAEGKTEKQIWAQTYEQDLRDVLSLQSEVATSIARQIQVKLTPREKRQLASSRTVNPAAYLAYSYGRYYWNKRTAEGFQKSIEYLQSATAKDPTYAPAYAGLADVFALLGSIPFDVLPPRQIMPRAKEAALQAVKLDESLAEGHASLGYALLSYDWELNGAEREFQRAIELNPRYATAHHWYAHYLLAKNQPEQALAEIKKARELDPASVVINMGVGWCLYHARRYDEAIEQYRATLDMAPDFPLAHATLGMAYLQKKAYSEAISEFKKAGGGAFGSFGLGCAYGLSGKLREARQILDGLEKAAAQRYIPATYIAMIYASVGDKDQSIKWARKAYDERSDYMIYLATEPLVDSLRPDARFQEILRLIAHSP